MGTKVSIVVSCYNKEPYVEATLKSIYDQTWDNVELVLINNGSTDGSPSILRKWEKKFIAKGFEVVLIDQENQGLPGAMLIGMKRMSGEYFCTVDADDEIYPDYVSTMAGWLDDHPDYEWASCEYEDVYNRDGGGELRTVHHKCAAAPDEPPFVENLLLMRNMRVVWRYVIRKSYIERCRVLENFATEPQITHEPQTLLPLFVKEGKLKHFPRALIKHYQEIGIVHAKTFERFCEIEGGMHELTKKTIDTLDVSENRKKRWKLVAELYHYEAMRWWSRTYKEKMDPSEAARLYEQIAKTVNGAFTPRPNIEASDIEGNLCPGLYYTAVSRNIIGDTKNLELPQNAARIIGYGALGKLAASRVPQLMGTILEPQKLWDRSAAEGEEICGIPVTEPELTDLNEDDILLVFPRNEEVVSEVRRMLKDGGIKCRVLYSRDIDRMLPEIYFPQFFNKCKLIYEG